MEILEETDNITKNIVQEIVRECKSHQIPVDENFCVYYVKLLTLDPIWKISPERKLNRENIQKIVTFIIRKFETPDRFDLITLKMQYAFLSHSTDKNVVIETHRNTVTKILNPLYEEILALNENDFKVSDVKVIRKVAMYITLMAGLGNPKQLPVLKEAMFALKSIWTDNDVEEFIAENTESKSNDIKHVEDLVMGIRLFNRDSGRSSVGIEDLPKLLSLALTATETELQVELLNTMEEVNLTTTAIENVYVMQTLDKPKIIQQNNKIIEITTELGIKCPDGVTERDVRDALHMLILSRQHEVYVRKLLEEIEGIEIISKTLFKDLEDVLKRLHRTAECKVAIPINIIFPLFSELAQIWKKIQNESIALSIYTQIFQKFKLLRAIITPNFKKFHMMLESDLVITDAVRLEKTMDLKIPTENNLCEVIYPSDFANFEKLPLKYLGFCVWSLVQTNGGLIPGNPNMGVCEWRKNYYAFSSLYAAAEFGKDPDLFLKQSLVVARNKPELINLLQLHDNISAVRDIGELYEKPVEVSMSVNSEAQTLLHPIPEYIDPNYVWNIWDYYRQAIKLTNITKCKTHSVQTLKSHYRAPQYAQTTEPRDKICQTKKDNYVNHAKLSNFIYGLRGRRDNGQHIVELTRPVDEERFYKCAMANADAPIYQPKCRLCRTWKKPTVQKQETKSTVSSSICVPVKQDSVSDKSDTECAVLHDCLCVTGLEIKK